MSDRSSVPPALRDFVADELIDGVLWQLKSGKEATVYVAHKDVGDARTLYAAKVYRDLEHRSFRRDEVYREGRWIGDERVKRAVRRKTRLGRAAAFGMWVNEEASMLRRAFDAGALVPEVIADRGPAILMEYIGDERGPAPMLSEVRLSRAEAQGLFEAVMADIEALLRADIVHSDLSPFNLLYWRGEAVIIDMPQAVDARLNDHAHRLLVRDIGNVCRYFRRAGVEAQPEAIAARLWGLYMRARL
jgi:RIO kinase 1